MSEWEIGEFDDDGALDERDEVLSAIIEKINLILDHPQFCGVDISGARANIAILTTVVRNCGGAHLIEIDTVRQWADKMDEPFKDEGMWGFTEWPPEVKQEWRDGCKATVTRLIEVLKAND